MLPSPVPWMLLVGTLMTMYGSSFLLAPGRLMLADRLLEPEVLFSSVGREEREVWLLVEVEAEVEAMGGEGHTRPLSLSYLTMGPDKLRSLFS